MDTAMGLIYTLIDSADSAAAEHRYERAQALATIAQARTLADIANALRDDEGNNVAHILHNMSYALATIAATLAAAAADDDEPSGYAAAQMAAALNRFGHGA